MKNKNVPLLLFDILCLPITVIRIILIYFFGSRYNIENNKFLDILLHSENPYFNQNNEPSVDTISLDIRMVIKNETKLSDDVIEQNDNIIDELKHEDNSSDLQNETNSKEKQNINNILDLLDYED